MPKKPNASPKKDPSAPEPLNPVHALNGWTPEGLRAELIDQGLDPAVEAAKIRAMFERVKAERAASKPAQD
jgi:hypothetical protein